MAKARVQARPGTDLIERADTPPSGDPERTPIEITPQEDISCLLGSAGTLRSDKPGFAQIEIGPGANETPELRDAHQELAKSKADIQSLISAIPVAIYRTSADRTGTTAFMSERWKEWTDNAASDFCRGPEAWPKAIHPDDRERILGAFNAACRKKSDYTLRYRIVHRETGAVRDVMDHGLPLLDENGDISSIHGVVMDVTEHSQAEGQVRHLLARQTAVSRLATALSESRDLGRIYRTIYDALGALVKTDAFIISFYDSRTGLISAGYAIGRAGEIPAGAIPPISLSTHWCGPRSHVVRTGEPVYIPDYAGAMESAGPMAPDVRIESANSAVFVPMRFRGRTVGVMQVQSHELDAYTQDEIDLFAAMASVATVAIQNAHLLRQVQQEITARKRAEELLLLHDSNGISGSQPEGRSQCLDRAEHPVTTGQTVDI